MNKKILLLTTLILCLTLLFNNVAFASEVSTTAKKMNKEGYYEITVPNSYLNTTRDSVINIPKELIKRGIDMITLSDKNTSIPVTFQIKKTVITIKPDYFLVDGATYSLRIFCFDDTRYSLTLKAYNIKTIDFTTDTYVKIPANPNKGFNYDYYLYIPTGSNTSSTKRLIVETNNTGTVSNSIEYHDERAYALINGEWNGGLGHWSAMMLKTPLIVPVFPRPIDKNWEIYPHALDKGTMETTEGKMARLDLQLVAMIEDAQKMLQGAGLKLEEKVFMTGFSASGNFAQRFTLLHPDKVKAVYAQGTGPLPISSYNGANLPYPAGTSDLKELTGEGFKEKEYAQVAKFYYMSDLDDHDVNDSYTKSLPNSDKIPELWEDFVTAYKTTAYTSSIQFNTYKGIGHDIPQSAYFDIVYFFYTNNGVKFNTIKAHSDAYISNADSEYTKLYKYIGFK